MTEQVFVLLVEDFRYADGQGRISKLVIDRGTMEVRECVPLINGKSHYSFPFVMHESGKVYICPENSCAGGLPIYEYHEPEGRCLFVREMSNQPLTDAVVAEVFGDRYMLSTRLPDANGKRLWVWKQENGSFSADALYSIDFQESVARNAGAMFKVGEDWYRPAQKCNQWYGHAISLQRVMMDNDKLYFEEVRRLTDQAGMHTFNVHDGVIVVDRKRFRIPWLSRLVYAFWKKKDL